jgi:hypothetical protein
LDRDLHSLSPGLIEDFPLSFNIKDIIGEKRHLQIRIYSGTTHRSFSLSFDCIGKAEVEDDSFSISLLNV